MSWSHHVPILDAFVLLMSPLVEVVIHDVETDIIIYINGKLSNRAIGDDSLLNNESFGDVGKVIYSKINFDGKLLKSISFMLDDQYMLCINCDVSVFSQIQLLPQAFTSISDNKPKSLFINDWQEKINTSIHHYIEQNDLSFNHLDHAQRKALVKHLYELGAFNEKNAPQYIAKTLNISRSTVFNYLKLWRELCV